MEETRGNGAARAGDRGDGIRFLTSVGKHESKTRSMVSQTFGAPKNCGKTLGFAYRSCAPGNAFDFIGVTPSHGWINPCLYRRYLHGEEISRPWIFALDWRARDF